MTYKYIKVASDEIRIIKRIRDPGRDICNISCNSHDLLARGQDLLSRSLDLLTRGHDLVSRGRDCHDLLGRGTNY